MLPKSWSLSSLFFSKTPWLWSFSSWSKLQSCGLVLHGFFQISQNHLLLYGRTLKAMIFFFLDFSKAPKVVVFSFMVFSKAPKVVLFLFLVFFQNSMAMVFILLGQNFKVMVFFFMVFSKVPKVVFFFIAVPSKPWSFSFWIFPKFPKLLSSSLFFAKLRDCGLLVLLLVSA